MALALFHKHLEKSKYLRKGYRENRIFCLLYCLLVLPIGPCYSLVEPLGTSWQRGEMLLYKHLVAACWPRAWKAGVWGGVVCRFDVHIDCTFDACSVIDDEARGTNIAQDIATADNFNFIFYFFSRNDSFTKLGVRQLLE